MEDDDVTYAYNISQILHELQEEEWDRPVVWPQDIAFNKTAKDRIETICKRAMEVFEPLDGHNWCFFKSDELRGHIPRLLAAGSEQGMALVLEFLNGVKCE
jgi:hypothetical protein